METIPLSHEEISKKLDDILHTYLGFLPKESQMDRNWGPLGADSMDRLSLTMCLEDEFNITILDSVAESLDTPRKVKQYLLDLSAPIVDAVGQATNTPPSTKSDPNLPPGGCGIHPLSSRACERGTKGCVVYHDPNSGFVFAPNELTALTNSPIALMELVNWWHCRETEDSAFSGERVDYKARREELTARAKAIVEQDPDCWPEDLVVELGLYEKNKVKGATWYPIDGDLRGYEGDIVVKHRDGSYRVGSTSWIGNVRVKTPRGAMACWQSCLRDGYVSWTPLG